MYCSFTYGAEGDGEVIQYATPHWLVRYAAFSTFTRD